MFILGYVIISLKRRVLYVELEKKFKILTLYYLKFFFIFSKFI